MLVLRTARREDRRDRPPIGHRRFEGRELVGGFHLFPAPDDYLSQVMAELRKFVLAHVMPMHCSGQNFVDLAEEEMTEKPVLCRAGSSFTFTA